MSLAGAPAVAGLKKYAEREGVAKHSSPCFQAPMNFDRIRHVAERAEVGEKREAILAVSILSVPVHLKLFVSKLVTETYRIQLSVR